MPKIIGAATDTSKYTNTQLDNMAYSAIRSKAIEEKLDTIENNLL